MKPPIDTTKSDPETKRRMTFKKRVSLRCMQLLGATIFRLIGLTTRYDVRQREKLEEYRGEDNGPVLIALWHGSCFAPMYYHRGNGMCVITSKSPDGQILSNILHGLGYQTVRGSSNRGATRAIIDLARIVNEGADACIAVDGPRGPALETKPGIILLAKITGRPILPIAASPKSYWQFQSWDRFRLPLPFTRAKIYGGTPVHVPPDADDAMMEQKRQDVQRQLYDLQLEVDADMQPRVYCRADRRPKDIQFWDRDVSANAMKSEIEKFRAKRERGGRNTSNSTPAADQANLTT